VLLVVYVSGPQLTGLWKDYPVLLFPPVRYSQHLWVKGRWERETFTGEDVVPLFVILGIMFVCLPMLSGLIYAPRQVMSGDKNLKQKRRTSPVLSWEVLYLNICTETSYEWG
jgi:hypothetical protein